MMDKDHKQDELYSAVRTALTQQCIDIPEADIIGNLTLLAPLLDSPIQLAYAAQFILESNERY